MNNFKRLRMFFVSFSYKCRCNPSCVCLLNQTINARKAIQCNAYIKPASAYWGKISLWLKIPNRSGATIAVFNACYAAWLLGLNVLLGWVLNATPPPMQSSCFFSCSRTLCEPKKWEPIQLTPKGGARGGFVA